MKLFAKFYKAIKALNKAHRAAVRIVLATAFILLLPLLAKQVTNEVAWDPGDFAVAGTLLMGTGFAYERVAKKVVGNMYRAAAGVALVTALLTLWINLAVGIIGTEGNPANLIYGGVLAVGVIGALISRFQPHGMSRALFATALAQALVAVIVLIAGLGSTDPNWPWDIVTMTGLFMALWLASAWLFLKAAREQAPTNASTKG